MSSDKEFIYCGKGILERIKEEEEKFDINNTMTEEDFIKCFSDRFNEIVKPQLLIIISNGLTKEQIEHIKHYYSNI